MDNGFESANRRGIYIIINMKAYIKAISYYLPETVVTNEELIKEFPEWSVEKIVNKVGIDQRHIAKPDETSADLATKAAEKLFANTISIEVRSTLSCFVHKVPIIFCPRRHV